MNNNIVFYSNALLFQQEHNVVVSNYLKKTFYTNEVLRYACSSLSAYGFRFWDETAGVKFGRDKPYKTENIVDTVGAQLIAPFNQNGTRKFK